jgi:hypothetical protein
VIEAVNINIMCAGNVLRAGACLEILCFRINKFVIIKSFFRNKWVPVTTAWRVLRLRIEKRPAVWRVAANMLNKQSRVVYKGWSSSLEFGRRANSSL